METIRSSLRVRCESRTMTSDGSLAAPSGILETLIQDTKGRAPIHEHMNPATKQDVKKLGRARPAPRNLSSAKHQQQRPILGSGDKALNTVDVSSQQGGLSEVALALFGVRV